MLSPDHNCFDIERSVDRGNFEQIEKEAARKTVVIFPDKTVPSSGVVYYRLSSLIDGAIVRIQQ